jgi:hypothetical protein
MIILLATSSRPAVFISASLFMEFRTWISLDLSTLTIIPVRYYAFYGKTIRGVAVVALPHPVLCHIVLPPPPQPSQFFLAS